MRAAKVQASLRIRAVSPEPSLLAHISSESRGTFRQKARSLAPLIGWACAVKICRDGMLEDTNSLDGAHLYFGQTFYNVNFFLQVCQILVLACWLHPRSRPIWPTLLWGPTVHPTDELLCSLSDPTFGSQDWWLCDPSPYSEARSVTIARSDHGSTTATR